MDDAPITALPRTPTRTGRGRRQPRAERPAGGPPTAASDRTGSTDPTGTERAPTVRRWCCPRCGATRCSLLTDGRTEAHVLNDLRSHLRAAGGAHGSPGDLPPGLDPAALGRYVGRGRDATADTHGDD